MSQIQLIVAQSGGGGGVITINGDTGSVTGSTVTISGGTTGLTTTGSGTTLDIIGTLGISNGGTNATSMANTDGVVYYDGTRLVTTAVGTATYVLTSNGAGLAPTFQAAGGGSTQALFQAYLTGNQTNVTGDGTTYTIQFNTTSYNVSSCFNTGTFTFTAPKTGKYIFTGACYGYGYGGGHTQQNINLILSGGTYYCYTVNPFAMSGNSTLVLPWSVTAPMTSGDTATVTFFANNSTKTVNLGGGSAGATTWSGSYISA